MISLRQSLWERESKREWGEWPISLLSEKREREIRRSEFQEFLEFQKNWNCLWVWGSEEVREWESERGNEVGREGGITWINDDVYSLTSFVAKFQVGVSSSYLLISLPFLSLRYIFYPSLSHNHLDTFSQITQISLKRFCFFFVYFLHFLLHGPI